VEGAGVVEAVGPDVPGLEAGARVAYALPVGGYAERRILHAQRLVRIPAAVSLTAAAGSMLRGVTAHMLLRRVWPLAPGETVLVHGAAGGLGLVLVQWAKRLGARVIGVVSDESKAGLARGHGADHVILRDREDFVARTLALTGSRGVDVAYDGVGGETLLRTLDCVRRFGLVASIGQASGSLPHIALSELGPRRSLALARPSVFAYAADPDLYHEAAETFLAEVERGLKLVPGAAYPIEAAADAHRDMEAGRTTGSPILTFEETFS
jgi:NADPH2:quinone reductase